MDKEKKNINDNDDKIENLINRHMPHGAAARKANLWLGSCVATMATGFYTYLIDWNPVLRASAHFTGAFAIPAGGAFLSSLAMTGIEKATNWGINSYNKKHPEKDIPPFEINPKVKTAIKFISSLAVGSLYTYGTLGTEAQQFAETGIPQYGQYFADIVGPIAGTFAFHKLSPKDALTSFGSKLWNSGKVLAKTINTVEDIFKGKGKEKNKNNIEKTSNLTVEEINIDPEMKTIKETETPAWDLSLYETSSKESSEKTNIVAPVQKIASTPTSNEAQENDEIDI